ncbi:unnamed protein product [Moneuplotes crassus]|uniref:Dynein light chain n=2 Tax=Euplotes crassus TaxID=5936 RepID=A0AAD1XY28_EUPCR|nr:unnamed protein product [Moneuplotes crassus]
MEIGQKDGGSNTYALEPREDKRFYPSKVKEEIKKAIDETMKDKEYNHKEAEKLSIEISNRIRDNVKNLSIDSYKIVVQTVIGEIGGQGVRIASKSLWDDKNDNWASYTFSNHSLFCTGMVFGIYYE